MCMLQIGQRVVRIKYRASLLIHAGQDISPCAAITHCHDKMLPGVNDAQVFVFACSDEEAAVAVPTDIVDEVSVQVIQGQ